MGSGDAFGSGGRLQTCIYVQSEESRFLIDCGASSLAAMKRFGVSPSVVDAALITHLHGDHFGGLPFLILDAQFVSHRTRPLILAGPPGLEARVREAMEVLFPGSSNAERRFPLEFFELAEGAAAEVGPLAVTPYAVIHPSGAPAYALRIEHAGKVISYSGDTEWTDALIQAARDADLFVCEAYSFEKKAKYHLDYRTLMDRRTELGCRRMVLTHMSDDMLDRLRELQETSAEWAEDGMTIVL